MKTPSKIIRFVAGAIGTLYLGTNCLFAYSTESNIWAERRKAREQRSSPTLLASLPVGSSVYALSTQFPTPQSFGSSLSPSLVHSVPKSFLKDHEGLLSALSPAYGTIRKVSLPSPSRAVRPMVIHIQDVHQNLDAQKNIGRLVGSLLASQQAGLIALEGIWGNINLQPFRDFPHRQAVKQSADYLLKENTISGPIHAILTGTGPLPPLIGIDDPTHYNANVEAYRQSAPRIAAIKKVLAQAKATLDQEKARVFTSELKTFDMAVEAYREGQSSLGDFVEILTNPRLQLEVPSSLQIFQETLAIEKALNFKEVERERAVLIERLVQKLSRKEMEELTRLSVAYRSSQVSYADFYTYLKGLCLRAGVALKSYPAMDDYIRYVLLADQINAETLLSELTSLERKAFAALAKSPEAQELVAQSRLSYLTAQLVDFSLTPDEWKEYLSLNNVENKATDFHSFEAFYKEAETRDQAMAENLLKAMGEEKGQSVAILVTGGYHSAGLTAQLTQAGATIISVVPKIEKVETAQGATYLSVFAQEKTPLEKLFVGEKLFLAQNPISQPTRQILAPTLMVLATVFLGQVSGISDLNSLYQSLGGLGTLSDLVSSNGGAVAITLSVGGAIYVVRAIKDKGEDIREFVVDPRSDNGNMFARALIFFKRAFAPLLVSLSVVKSAVASQPIPVPFSSHSLDFATQFTSVFMDYLPHQLESVIFFIGFFLSFGWGLLAIPFLFVFVVFGFWRVGKIERRIGEYWKEGDIPGLLDLWQKHSWARETILSALETFSPDKLNPLRIQIVETLANTPALGKLSERVGEFLKRELSSQATSAHPIKVIDREEINSGRATSRWMTRLFESVGYLFGGEEGRRKAGDHYPDHAPIYEWTLGLGGMIVNLGVILFLSGSGLERVVAFLVGAGWGSLFYLSHFGVTTETVIKVSKRRAATMAIIYAGLIFITPFPILEFLEYHSFASEFLLSVVGSWWLGALGLHKYFDKKKSDPIMGKPAVVREEGEEADGLSRDGHFWLKNFLKNQYELDITSVRSASTGDGDQFQKDSYFIQTRDGENFVFHLAGVTLNAARAYVSAQLSPSLDGKSQPHFIRHQRHYDEKFPVDDYILLWEGVRWVLERQVDHGNPLTHTPSVTPHGGRGEGVWSDERGQVTEIVLIELGSRPTDQNVNEFMSQAARLTVAEYSRRATQTSIPLSAPWSIENTGTPVLIVDEGSVRTAAQRENLALLVKKHPHSAIITNATGLSVSGVGSALIFSRPGAFTQRQTQEGIPLGIWDVSLSSLEDEFSAIAQTGNGTGFRFMQTEVLHLNVEGLTIEQNSILEAAQRAWILNALFQLTLPARSLDWTGIIETLTAIARYA